MVAEHGFENNNLHGWVPRGGVGEIALSSEAHSGSASLKMMGRTLDWHMARVELTSVLEGGATYAIELYVRLAAGDPPNPINLTMLTRSGDKDVETSLSGDVPVTNAAWIKLAGEYVFDKKTTGAFLYLYLRNNPTGSYLVDDLKVTMTAPPPASAQQANLPTLTYDFEKGSVEGWLPKGTSVQLASVGEAAQSGSSSLKTTNRSVSWNGPSLEVKEVVKKAGVYEISGYVKLAKTPASASTIKFTIEKKPAGGQFGWKTVAQQTVSNTEWTKLAGLYSNTAAMDALQLHAESSNADEVFYLDNVNILTTVAPPEVGIQTDIPSLKDVFKDYFIIGAAVEPNQLTGLTAGLLKKHCNCIVAENVMKPISIQPVEGVFAWEGADKIFEFAEANKIIVRFHGNCIPFSAQGSRRKGQTLYH